MRLIAAKLSSLSYGRRIVSRESLEERPREGGGTGESQAPGRFGRPHTGAPAMCSEKGRRRPDRHHRRHDRCLVACDEVDEDPLVRNVGKVLVALAVLAGGWRSWVRPGVDHTQEVAIARVPGAAAAQPSSVPRALGGSTVVPRVTGLSGSYAREILQSSGLRLGEIRLRSSSEPWGAVLSQSINAGVRVRTRTSVDLVLVRGTIAPCWPSSCGIPHGRSRGTRVEFDRTA
jgi:PASTA domain